MCVRESSAFDKTQIYNVYYSAFPKEERDLVAKLSLDLLAEQTTPPTISLVVEIDAKLVGHVVFSPVKIEGDENLQGYTLAPLAILPKYQKQGIGSKLVKYGIQQLKDIGVDFVLIYGDPKYYGRFGFRAETAENYIPRYKLEYPFGWQGLMLNDSVPSPSSVQITCVDSLNNPALW